MPWTDELVEPHLRRCIRDLVALSKLPAMWKDYTPQQIADSVAAALLSMLNADVVCVSIPGLRDEPTVEVMRANKAVSPELSGRSELLLRCVLPGRFEQTYVIDNPLGDGTLRIAAVPIGLGGNAVIVAGSANPQFPGETHRLLLGIAANDATIALQRWHADAAQRHIVALIERSSDFVGFADLDGKPQYLNAAGCELVGLSDIEEAKKFNVFDFIAPHEQARARHELFPLVVSNGRWVGEINFRHFKTGEIIPFFLDWFRIDDLRTGRPMNIAAVGRDLRGLKTLEADLRRLNESLEQRVAERAAELARALERVTIEVAERTRADAKAHELQLELFHSSRLSAAGKMAGALAHELNQPLAAFTNSINAGRRLMAKGAQRRIDTVRGVLNEAADHRSLERLLDAADFRVVSYSTPTAFLDVARSLPAGCVLLDLRMPEMSGLEVQARLLTRPDLPVIVMTGQGEVQSAVQAMKAGALDFIEKPYSDDALIATIECALKRDERNNQAELVAAVALINTLSTRERQVLDALVTGQSNKVIAFDLGISVRTVEVHRGRMMDRLGVRHFAEAVRLAVLAKLAGERLEASTRNH